ncbi:unnamed protein product [Clavelina lepadiformis]|uniref:Fe2OG dioxygenase domain-containing protein n=1 Tax=Clavelina lepadiformis TaxID=159417 RepID=A0ABP0FLC2_CLALP
MSVGVIPVVDYNSCGLHVSDQQLKKEDLYNAGKELVDAFSALGFVYLTNSGVDPQLLAEAQEITNRFFRFQLSQKQRYSMEESIAFGYIGLGREEAGYGKVGDFKESFNFDGNSVFNHPDKLPEDICPGILDFTKKFMAIGRKLAERIMDSLTMGMELKEESNLKKYHRNLHNDSNNSAMRLNYYGSATDNNLKAGRVRLGAHTDWGTFTLLFQDNVGGLQLEHNGDFIDAVPLQNAIVINIGDSLNLLSCGQLKSKEHRVVVPEEEVRQKLTRHSYVYFLVPDDDAVINHPLLYEDEKKNEKNFKNLPSPLNFEKLCSQRFAEIHVPKQA